MHINSTTSPAFGYRFCRKNDKLVEKLSKIPDTLQYNQLHIFGDDPKKVAHSLIERNAACFNKTHKEAAKHQYELNKSLLSQLGDKSLEHKPAAKILGFLKKLFTIVPLSC
ncbi:MAG: hypothetical protein A2Y25_08890 [Candidatus Melainabacteria bacterium GWF2_37_15]|nr:MAG: hypothetical protein A2Y25_08890 [Candidatus Melainabacteria bacterium GWF2_37_15]